MNTKTISLNEADDLSNREESHFFDKKSFFIKGVKVQKIAVAFANADGGEFIIGIADEKEEPDPSKRWQGASRIEGLNSHLQAVFEVTPSLDLKYEILKVRRQAWLYFTSIDRKKVLKFIKTSDGTVYQRHGAQSLPIKDPQKNHTTFICKRCNLL